MTIDNFKLKDFLLQPKELIQQYIVILTYKPPIPTRQEVFHMKLKHVEMIKTNIYNNDDADVIKVVAKVQKMKVGEVLNMRIVEFFGLLNSIKKQVERIALAEENKLSATHTNIKWETVNGSKRMAKYGIYNTLDDLTGERIWLNETIMNLPYSEVFTTLCKRKDRADLQREMDAIKTTKTD